MSPRSESISKPLEEEELQGEILPVHKKDEDEDSGSPSNNKVSSDEEASGDKSPVEEDCDWLGSSEGVSEDDTDGDTE